MEQQNKPMCLEYEEAKNEIFSTLNNVMRRGTLPLFVVEIILKDAIQQIGEGARNELLAAKTMYERQIEESKKDG